MALQPGAFVFLEEFMLPLRLTLSAVLCSAAMAGAPSAADAQGSGFSATELKARFDRLDANASGRLSGRELEACRCRAYDRNGDGEVTREEYYRGEIQVAAESIRRGGGRPSAKNAPSTVADPPPGRTATPRPTGHAAEGPPEKTGQSSLPPTVPAGLYNCQLYLAASANVGRLRILAGGAYTGLSTSGSGPQGRFTYDQSTGKIDWGAALQGFPYLLQSSQLQSNPRTPAANGGATPFIVVHYQIRPGGNVNSMSCVRMGS
jgi:hypothetical protein